MVSFMHSLQAGQYTMTSIILLQYSRLVSGTHEFSQIFRFGNGAAVPCNLLLLASPHQVPQQTSTPPVNQPRQD
jgi:hypothetical protein